MARSKKTLEDLYNEQPDNIKQMIEFIAAKAYKQGKKDFERPQAKWIEKEETPASVSYYCSNCKMEGIPVTPFCPWCGAEMHETEEENGTIEENT